MSGSNEGNQRHIFTQVAIPPNTIGNWIQAWSTPILESMLRVNLSAIGRYE